MSEEVKRPELGNILGETDFNFPGLQLISGDHPTTPELYRQLNDRFYAGDLTATIWNPEVGQKVRFLRPKVLVIDGLAPYATPSLISGMNEIDVLKEIWLGLPDRPNAIDPETNKVIVVAGDIRLQDGLNTIKKMGHNSDNFGLIVNELRQLHNETNNAAVRRLIVENLAIFGICNLAGGGISAAALVKSLKDAFFQTGKENIDRRDFLKITAAMAGFAGSFAASIGRPYGVAKSAYSSSVSEQNLWQALTRFYERLFPFPEWIQGRSTLLLAKTKDALEALNMPHNTSGTIIMGNTHMLGTNQNLQDPLRRSKVLTDLATLLVKKIDTVLDKYPQLPKKEAHNAFLDYLAGVQIYEVTDPGEPSPYPYLAQRATELVKPKILADNPNGLFQSKQVEQAISQLRI